MDDTRKSAPWLTERLRQRVASGEWAPGTMIPGRRTLTLEYRAALSTVEKSVATLIAEGLLRADDRRGTYVSTPSAPAALASTPASRTQVYANVGLVAGLVPYDSPAVRREQWPARMLEACEHALAAEPGVSHTFINMEPEPGRSEDPDAAVRRLQADAVDAVIFIEPDASGRRMIRTFVAAGTPVVCAALDPVLERVPHVCADDLAGGALA
nr:GntR family transcriptional regulator [Planctomycetota bacterium]